MAESQDPKLEQNKNHKQEPMSISGKVIVIGLVGGIFWSLLAYLASIINFTEISPNLVLQPWAIGDWKNGTLGNLISVGVIGLLSILVAFIYYGVLKRMKGMLPGIVLGLALWGLVFFVLNPIFPNLKSVMELERNTIITTLCLYILYGVFIGYSISFEVQEMGDEVNHAPVNQ